MKRLALLLLFCVSVFAQFPTPGGSSGGSSTPGGSDTQLQYNNAGTFGGAAFQYGLYDSTSPGLWTVDAAPSQTNYTLVSFGDGMTKTNGTVLLNSSLSSCLSIDDANTAEMCLNKGGSFPNVGSTAAARFGGQTNQEQLLIKANVSQSVNIAEFRTSDDTVILELNVSGNLVANSASVAPAVSGCTSAAIVAGSTALAGQINTTPTGSCVVTLTFATAAPHGYNCAISNQTTANLIRQTASTTTTAVFTGTTVANDVLAYGPCVGW